MGNCVHLWQLEDRLEHPPRAIPS